MRINLLFIIFILFCNSGFSKKNIKPPALAEWKLFWNDEFEGKNIDNTKWTLCKRGYADWKNTMSNDPRLLVVKEGILFLRGIANDNKDKDPAPYITAGITSKSKFNFTYGKVQIRARFQSAKGAWPALWMLGEGQWPSAGEIDIMEHLNFENKIHQTLHSDFTQRNKNKENKLGPKNTTTVQIDRDMWNTYGCEWNSEKIVFTVNNKPTYTYPRVPSLGKDQFPFHVPSYFMLTMQIGGSWVGKANPSDYPAVMEVDWIRVYKRE